MAKSSMQKAKLLYLQKILLEKTDENNALTLAEIKEQLEGYGIKTERKSLYSDLEILQSSGLDICRIRTNTVRYFVGSRDFELPELKLLVDAIQSSKFITYTKSLKLIRKIEGLVSENEGKLLNRQVYVTNRVKNLNEQIYYNVDDLHNAISSDRMISFRYMEWRVNFGGPRKIIRAPKRGGKLYTVSPWALCWDDENYYLVAYDGEAGIIKHYRVDKMESIEQLDKKREGTEIFKDFNLPRYSKSVFSMFGGEECDIKLSVDNSLVGVFADRFGSDLFIIRESDSTFIVTVKVTLSSQFFAWLFGLGEGVKILSPQKAVEQFKDKISTMNALYS